MIDPSPDIERAAQEAVRAALQSDPPAPLALPYAIRRDPISRKLVGGIGLGAAVVIIVASAIRHLTGYQVSADEAQAAQAIVSAVIGYWIDEEKGTET